LIDNKNSFQNKAVFIFLNGFVGKYRDTKIYKIIVYLRCKKNQRFSARLIFSQIMEIEEIFLLGSARVLKYTVFNFIGDKVFGTMQVKFLCLVAFSTK
jgi:hypothetical protein